MGNQFKKAYQNLNKAKNLKNDDVTLASFIKEAIEVYQNANPNKRDQDIGDIQTIVGIKNNDSNSELEEDKDNSDVRKIQALRYHFNGPGYQRGYFKRSYLEDCVYAAIFLYQEAVNIRLAKENLENTKNQAVKKAITSLQSQKILPLDIDTDRVVQAILKYNPATVMDVHPSYAQEIINRFNNTADEAIEGSSSHTEESNSSILTEEQTRKISKNADKINASITAALSKLEPNVSYSQKSFTVTFESVIKQAIRQYTNSKLGILSEQDTHTIEGLDAIISQVAKDKDSINTNINNINTQFAHQAGLFSRTTPLEAVVRQTINGFITEINKRNRNDKQIISYNRILQVKKWRKVNVDTDKIVIMVHGLQDSVDTFDHTAEQYIAAGYTVVAYDQAGCGYDELRNKKGILDIPQMQADFHNVLCDYVMNDGVNEVIIVGHSLGGSVIANSLITIEELNDNQKIKKIQLLAPAAMANPIAQTIKNLPTVLRNPSDKNQATQIATKGGLKRIGGASATSSFRDFIKFTANAFKALRALVNNTISFNIPVEIYYGKEDGLVRSSNFHSLNSLYGRNQQKINEVSFERFDKGTHHLHQDPCIDLNLVKDEVTGPSI